MTRARDTSQTQDNGGLAAAPFVAGKNKIINGDFFVNQRSFTSTTTSGTFGFDRWFTGFSGGTVTYSNQAFTPGAAPVAGYESSTFARLVSASQSAAGDYATLQQKIEDVRTFAGQTITYSFWAKASTGTPNVGITLVQNFGSGGSAGVVTSPAVKPITTSWARYSFNVNVPSVSGKTIGTSSALETIIFTSNGATLQASGYAAVGVQNATIDIWGVQLEAGSVATAFQTATGTFQGELAACQRYFYTPLNTTTDGIGGSPFLGMGWASSTTTAYILCSFPVTMRAIPSYTYSYASSSLSITTASYGVTTVTSLGADQIMQRNAILSFSASGGGLVAGNAAGVRHDGAGTYIAQFSAEL